MAEKAAFKKQPGHACPELQVCLQSGSDICHQNAHAFVDCPYYTTISDALDIWSILHDLKHGKL